MKVAGKISTDFNAVAQKYVEDVLSGEQIACKWVKLACERQQRDLAKQEDESYPWKYDATKGERVCKFISNLPHVKGPLGGKKIKLEAWQVFILMTTFSWVSKDNGNRRFRRVYLELGKGNGKSALSSAIALYLLAADNEQGAEVYSAARNREQARVVFDVAQAMARRSPDFRKKFGVQVLAHTIVKRDTLSVFKSLASDGQSLEGINVHGAILDEVHAHAGREVYDAISSACQKRLQSLLWMITTAGTDQSGVGFEMNTFTRKLLDRLAVDDSFFGIIFTIDAEDRWDVEDSWKRANPNYGVSVMPDALAQEANRARQLPSQQSNFRTKHLCQWMSADTTWLDARKLEACADPKLNERDFSGQQCTMGLDLASKLDLCAAVKVFTRTIEGQTHYYAFGKYWLPEDTVNSSNNASYRGWERQGYLTVTSGSVTDLDFIEEEIRQAAKNFEVREIAYDTFQATMLANHLLAEGLAMVETAMIVRNLSPAMKLLEELISNGRFHFNGDPVLAWCISNVVCHRDVKDNVYPRKQNDDLKIDACVALLMALGRTILQPLGEGSVYDKRGLLTL